MRDGFDISELYGFSEKLILTSKEASKAQRKFLQKQGNKLKRKTKAKVRALGIKQHTGNYNKRIKRGKVWTEANANVMSVRVYSNAPHAHLIEKGHEQTVNPGKGKGNGRGVIPGKGIGRKVGEVEGFGVFEKAQEEFEPEFASACEDVIDELIDKI